MKDVNREAIYVYRRDAWLPGTGLYAGAVSVPERLTDLETIGTAALPMKLPAAEYWLGSFIVGRIGWASGKWTWGQSSPILSAGDWSASWRNLAPRAPCSTTLIMRG